MAETRAAARGGKLAKRPYATTEVAVTITRYERDNLLTLIRACSGDAGHSVMEAGNTGAWLRQLGHKLNPDGSDWGAPNCTAEEIVRRANIRTAAAACCRPA